MFTDTQLCPCIFASEWVSHEDSCAAANHDCLTCSHCMSNINYWGQVDELLKLPVRTNNIRGHNGLATEPKVARPCQGNETTTKRQPVRQKTGSGAKGRSKKAKR